MNWTFVELIELLLNWIQLLLDWIELNLTWPNYRTVKSIELLLTEMNFCWTELNTKFTVSKPSNTIQPTNTYPIIKTITFNHLCLQYHSLQYKTHTYCCMLTSHLWTIILIRFLSFLWQTKSLEILFNNRTTSFFSFTKTFNTDEHIQQHAK